AVDGRDEGLPGAALPRQHLLAGAGDPVVAPAPLPGLLDPFALQPAALLETVEERVQRGDVEADHAAGAGGDELRDLVAVARAGLDEREDEQLGAALLQLSVSNRWHSDILMRWSSGVKGASEVGCAHGPGRALAPAARDQRHPRPPRRLAAAGGARAAAPEPSLGA